MRGALTLNQSETDKSKPTNLKSVLTSSRPMLFEVCVPIIIVAYFALPSMGACYGRSVASTPSSKTKEKTSKSEVPAG